jgi:hypothetical protein
MHRDLWEEMQFHYMATEPDRRGWMHIACPFCGKEPPQRGPNKPNFSFNHNGYKCYSCGATGNIYELAKHVGVWDGGVPEVDPRSFRAKPPVVEKEIPWAANASTLLKSYVSHPKKVERWREYKPLSSDTIELYRFGVGKLPGDFDERLIVPVFGKNHESIVGFHGRSLTRELKWKSAKGSHKRIPWGWTSLGGGEELWIVENYADAALLMQIYPSVTAIGMGMVRVLREDELNWFKLHPPASVTVAFDNDMAGQASDMLYLELCLEWKRKHPKAGAPPPRHGPVLVEQLQKAGIKAQAFEWRPEDRPKKDIGELLQEAWNI